MPLDHLILSIYKKNKFKKKSYISHDEYSLFYPSHYQLFFLYTNGPLNQPRIETYHRAVAIQSPTLMQSIHTTHSRNLRNPTKDKPNTKANPTEDAAETQGDDNVFIQMRK